MQGPYKVNRTECRFVNTYAVSGPGYETLFTRETTARIHAAALNTVYRQGFEDAVRQVVEAGFDADRAKAILEEFGEA